MNEATLKVKRRPAGKKSVKSVRNAGNVPGVFYVKGQEPVAIEANLKELRPLIYTSDAKLVKLEIEGMGAAKDCVVKDVDFHPVTEKILHFDMFGLTADRKITVEVPIVLKGTSIGVREGGVLQHTLRKVKVTCVPADLPSHIDVEISGLKIGKSILIRDIINEKYQFSLPGDALVVAVTASRTSKA